MLLERQPPLKSPYFYSVFLKTDVKKNPKFFGRVAPKNVFFGKMLNNKSELTNWAQNTKQKDTNWHQHMSQKILKNPYFCCAKMVPQEVVLFLTLEVVLFLTLEKAKKWYQN